nr:ATP-binding protein [uncultured Methanobacterium sp.]
MGGCHIIFEKSIKEIEERDIERLKYIESPEGRNLEYKSSLDIYNNDHKRSLLKAVSAFANTNGGLLIYGVEEDEGIPTEINGITVNNKDELGIWIEQYVGSNSEPRIPSLEIEFIDKNNSSNVFILVKVPRSWNSPHRVSMGPNTQKFYIRRGRFSEEMDYFELKNAFNLSETLIEKINNFRNERISSVLSENRTPFSLTNGSKTIIHLIPLNSFYTRQNYEFDEVVISDSSKLKPVYGVNYSLRRNFDGLVTHNMLLEGKTHSYTQLYRNGIIEAVSVELFNNDEKQISRGFHEIKIVEAINNYLKIYEEVQMELPILVFITLIGVKDYTMYIAPENRMFYHDTFKIDRDILELPEVILKKYEENIGNIFKPCFDSIWNACGYNGSENYNRDGEWNPRR